MKKAVIFDLNGVFIQSPKLSLRYAEKFGISEQEFLVALKEIMAIVRLPGAGEAYSYWKPYLDKWGINLNHEEFLHFWFSAEGGNEEMVSLARELKARGFKLFIHSNNFRERSDYYKNNFPFLTELFDKLYYSWQTGYMKPDERGFRLILEENNLRPEECIYFDDSEHNVEAAKSLGLESYIFEGPEQVKGVIEKASSTLLSEGI